MTDPLDGADVGETVQATETQRYCWWGSAGSQWLGEDRETENLEITDAYFDGEPGNEEVILEVSGEVTRRLPRAAFDFPEPTEPKSTPAATPTPRWKQIAGRVAPLAVSSVITVGVFVAVFNQVAGSISGQTVEFASIPTIGFDSVIFVLILAFLIFITVPIMPGQIGGNLK